MSRCVQTFDWYCKSFFNWSFRSINGAHCAFKERDPGLPTHGQTQGLSCPTRCAGVALHKPLVKCYVINCTVGHQIAISYDMVS